MTNAQIRYSIRTALLAHENWKDKLNHAIVSGTMPTKISDVSRDDNCSFGRWLNSDQIPAHMKRGKPYQVIKRLHAEFHTCVGEILLDAVEGRSAQAIATFEGEYEQRSRKLNLALRKWEHELQDDVAA